MVKIWGILTSVQRELNGHTRNQVNRLCRYAVLVCVLLWMLRRYHIPA
jgi:hypothetical protein